MNKAIRIFSYLLFSLFLVFALLIAIFESPSGRSLARKILVDGLHRAGMVIEVGSLSGQIPHQIDLKQVSIKGIANRTVHIDEMHLTISLIQLLRKELRIEQLTARGISFSNEQSSSPGKMIQLPFPFTLNIESFELIDLQLPEKVDLIGHLKIKRNDRGIDFQCIATRPEFLDSIAELTALKGRAPECTLHLKITTPTLTAFQPWLNLDAEGPLHLQFDAKGTPEVYSGKFSGTFAAQSLPFLAPLDKLHERDWVFRGKIEQRKDKPLQLRHIIASSSLSRFKGSLQLTDQYKIAYGQLQMEVENSLIEADFKRAEKGYDATAHWKIPHFKWDRFIVEQASGECSGLLTKQAFLGKADLQGRFLSEQWNLSSPVTYRAGDALILENLAVRSPLLEASGDLVYRNDGLFVGQIALEKGNLQLVQRLFPSIELFGQATGNCFLGVQEGAQTIEAHLAANEIYLGQAYASQANLNVNWNENLSLELTEARYEQLLLDRIVFETHREDSHYPCHFALDGTWKDPLQATLDGVWTQQKGEFLLTAQKASGTMLQYPIELLNPVKIGWENGFFLCEQLRASIGLAEVFCDFKGKPHASDGRLVLDRVPLDFLSLNPLDVAVTGTISLDADLKERDHDINGNLKISLENVHVAAPGEKMPLLAQGVFEGSFNRERLILEGGFQASDIPVLSLSANLPIHLQLWPFTSSFKLDQPARAQFSMNGRIEDFLDFLNTSASRIEGTCACDLTLRNTLAEPRLSGFCKWEHGSYQNYVTGTELTEINTHILAESDQLLLQSFTAQDIEKQGALKASGSMRLSSAEDFPFHLDVEFQKFHLVHIDFIEAQAEGQVSIAGNLNSATAKGVVQILQTDMTIPNQLPSNLPDLQVIYKNAPKPIRYAANPKSAYPLHLDLQIQAPNKVFISGRGLESEWKGDFHLGGTASSPAPKGTLELMHGELLFAGRRFQLSDGLVSLSGLEREMPFLDISANVNQKGISITARLRGPLNQPQLTLQSTPPLPLSGILAALLFGQDLPEIDSFQAIQLASTAASLQDNHPGVLENTRKSLGLDRLQIVSSQSGSDEISDMLALQVGKYVAQGVLVSITQGAEDSSTNISIEVDLFKGFVFQAESLQQQEQGKFTVKWNHTY